MLELKTQNGFLPDLESAVLFLDNDVWKETAVPSPAICQLGEVEVIKSDAQDNVEYHLTLKGSAGGAVLCDIKISKGVLELQTDPPTSLLTTTESSCDGTESENYKVFYKGEEGKKILQISAKISVGDSLTCQLKEHTTATDEGAEDNIEIIDTKYLSVRSFGVWLIGTKVAVDIDGKYEIKKNEFYCGIRGSWFQVARITCGGTSGEPTVNGLQATCPDILITSEASCKFVIPTDELDGKTNDDLLVTIEFRIQRTGITYYNCEAGYELDLPNGVCSPCDSGKYKPTDSTVSCEPCDDPDKYAPNVGSSACSSCTGGYVTENHKVCTKCNPDEVVVTVGDTKECQQCQDGKYPKKTSSSDGGECEDCSEFQYSKQGYLTCIYCEKGRQVNGQNTWCDPCDAGEYNDEPKTSKCKSCPDGTTTTSPSQETCSVVLEVYIYCTHTTYKDLAVGSFIFTSRIAGVKSRSSCEYNTISYAYRLCNKDGNWDPPDISECNSIYTVKLETIYPYAKIDGALDELIEITQAFIAPKDVTTLVNKMSDQNKMKDKFESESGSSIEDLTNKIVTVVSNLMIAAQNVSSGQDVKTDLVGMTEDVFSVALINMKADDDIITLDANMMAVYLLKNASSAPKMSVGATNIEITVSKDSSIGKLAVSIYKDNSMFMAPDQGDNISGNVVGLTTDRGNETQNVKFTITFDRHEVSADEDGSKTVVRLCKYYETKTPPMSDLWSSRGCSTTSNKTHVVCECDHMTSFAVILSVSEDMTASWLSDLVLGINIVFCLLTLLCTLPFRTFRVRKMTIIQSHSILCLILLCTCWYLMHLDFGDDKVYDNTECKVVAFIAHYFLMATFCWICCCTLTLKSQIVDAVKSFGKKNKNLVKKCVLFSYGFPLLVPTMALILNYLFQSYHDNGGIPFYIRDTECWYEKEWMYCFILFPIYVFMTINFVYFFKIMRVVGNARRASDGSSERRVVKAGFALAFTQGLPWIVHPGVIAGQSAAMLFQYLFLVTFGLQGLGLFVFNVLFQEEVLKNLCGMLNVKPPDIFLSVVPKQRQSPHTGETSMATSRNCSSHDAKSYSNNITLNNVSAVGDKSIYQDSTYYNELHENSIVTEHRYETQCSPPHEQTARSEGSRTELFDKKVADCRVRFVGNNRVYTAECSSDRDVQRSPIPGVTESSEYQCPPLM